MRVLFKNGTVVSGKGTRRADVLYMWSSMVLSIAAVCGGYYLGTKFNTFE